jgi:hypothetical protein
MRLSASLALVLLVSACGSHFVVRGTSLYEDGRYVEAAEVFEMTEQRLSESSNAERARFGLYRGATFLKLGDVPHAARWLGYSRSIVKHDPEALAPSESALLDASLAQIGAAHAYALNRAPNEGSEVATAPPVPRSAVAQ